MYNIYGDLISGNCYKIKLLVHQLDIPHNWIHTDIMQGTCRTESFLQKNPNGKVPLLETIDGQCLPESNAILFYLAENTALLPSDRFLKAQVLQWLFFEQYSHEPYIATTRFIVKFLKQAEEQKQSLSIKYEKGYKALDVMENHLQKQPFFAGKQYSIADIALYAYTHIAHEGGFDLGAYHNIQNWFERIQQQPRYLSLEKCHITSHTQ